MARRVGGDVQLNEAFAAETLRVLRSRLRWFAGVWLGLSVALLAARYWGLVVGGGRWMPVLHFIDACWLVGTGASALASFRRLPAAWVIRVSIIIVVWSGLYAIARNTPDDRVQVALLLATPVHIAAASVFPWTPLQAVWPMAILCAVSIGVQGVSSWLAIARGVQGVDAYGFWSAFGTLVAHTMFGGIGILIAWTKQSNRFRDFRAKYFENQLGDVTRELAYARRIHESLFPAPEDDGPIRMAYRYEPARLVGGDFLALYGRPPGGRLAPDGAATLVIIDVTGHGVPAALAVNRLSGELDMAFAVNSEMPPAELLRRLNHYVHLTLTKHQVFASCLIARVDVRRGTLVIANAGHPPPLLRARGTVEYLPATASWLGVSPADSFSPGEIERPWTEGMSLLAYTDGVIEAREGAGRMLGLAGLREAVSKLGPDTASRDLPDAVMARVRAHSGRSTPEDDTLVVVMY